jgi:hypothetical protein
MIVRIGQIEYSLYIGTDGRWIMHTWDLSAPEGDRWLDSTPFVNERDPFLSTVKYDAFLSTVKYDAWR